MIAFGPVPSRRLGRSLGISNIPPKICTYSCVYCQLGRTNKLQVKRNAFYKPEDILKAVEEKIEKTKEVGGSIDYLTIVSDGEPTLDINLGREIELLSLLGIKIAVITNASLLWRKSVREALMKADWVSLKVDSPREGIWRMINRPHRTLNLASILDGMLEFARMYGGELATETMLVQGVNANTDHIEEITHFLIQLNPTKTYFSIPIRPPAEKWVQFPSEKAIIQAYQIVHERMGRVEYLIGYEGNAFAFTGNVEENLVSIMAVHPMREDAVREFLKRAKANWSVINHLIAQGQLIEMEYEGKRFYMRKLPGGHW